MLAKSEVARQEHQNTKQQLNLWSILPSLLCFILKALSEALEFVGPNAQCNGHSPQIKATDYCLYWFFGIQNVCLFR